VSTRSAFTRRRRRGISRLAGSNTIVDALLSHPVLVVGSVTFGINVHRAPDEVDLVLPQHVRQMCGTSHSFSAGLILDGMESAKGSRRVDRFAWIAALTPGRIASA